MPFPILAAIAAVQAIGGIAKATKGASDRDVAEQEAKALLEKRKPYKIPQEVFDILNATQSNAQTGYGAETLDYLTNQTNQAFSSSIQTAQQLGADPNALSAIFGQKVDGIMQIGAQNHQLQMQNFSQYLAALNTVAGNRDAVWQSEQNLIKDQQQAAQARRMAGVQEVATGTNMIFDAAANYGISKLYGSQNGGIGSGGNNNELAYDKAKDQRYKSLGVSSDEESFSWQRPILGLFGKKRLVSQGSQHYGSTF